MKTIAARLDPVHARRVRLTGAVATRVCLTVGLVVMVGGWLCGVEILKSFLPGFATMKFNTALIFAASGLALVVVDADPSPAAHRIGRGCAWLVLLLAALTLAEYVLGLDLGIDEALVRDPSRAAMFPGRMAPATALSLTCLGAALVGMRVRLPSGAHPLQWFAVPTALAGFLATLGYLYDVRELYRVEPFSSVAVHTAVLLMVVAIAYAFVVPDNGVAQLLSGASAGSLLARRLVPAAVLLPPFIGWLRLLGERAGFYSTSFGLALFATSNVVVFSLIVWTTARAVQRQEAGRARLNEELQRSNDALVSSNQELQQFAYIASHDLAAPLRSVSSFLDLLRSTYEGTLDARADDWMRRASDGAKRMHALINDLLGYARIDSREVPFHDVPLDDVLAATCGILAPSIEELGATVTADPLPTVKGDPTQLQQLVQNLVGNALKYHGARPPRVHVSARRDGAAWVCAVRDDGLGVAAEHHEAIFQIFRRVHRRDEYPGTGIGLAICRRVVERHGGRIWIESTLGEGSTFLFTLPAAADDPG